MVYYAVSRKRGKESETERGARMTNATLNQTQEQKINTLLDCFHSDEHNMLTANVYVLVSHMRDVLKTLGVDVTIAEQHEAVISQILEWRWYRENAKLNAR
jgi:hypothetical protein